MARHYSIMAPKYQERPITVGEKLCSKCKTIKSADAFSIDKYKKSGLKSSCRDCNREFSKEYAKMWREKNREIIKERTLWHDRKSSYGITKDQYFEILSKQNGACAICLEKSQNPIKMHVDHCHSTGKIRGILCRGCNQGLGFFKDNVTIIKIAALYLEENGNG